MIAPPARKKELTFEKALINHIGPQLCMGVLWSELSLQILSIQKNFTLRRGREGWQRLILLD